MNVNERISKDFRTFKIDSEINKCSLWRNVELLTYLVASKELSLEDAECYSKQLFKILEDVKP